MGKKVTEAAELNLVKYVFDELNETKLAELRLIGIGCFVDGANWAIDKACKWLEENADTYIGVEGYAMLQDKFFEDFRKAMEK